MFVDDIPNVNRGLCEVKQYFDVNKLIHNVQKYQFMLTGTHQSIAKMADVRIHINNEPYQQCFSGQVPQTYNVI